MDLRLIRYFVAVVDHGGVTKAAKALFIAQPSLSQAVKTLERQVSAELFDRSGPSLRLTDTGRVFEVAARQVMRDVESAYVRVEAVREIRSGRLRISSVADAISHPLPVLARTFHDQHPGVEIHISDAEQSEGAVSAVRQGQADVGIVTLPVNADGLTIVPLAPQRIVLAMKPELASTLPDPVPQTLLAELPLIRSMADRFLDLLPPAQDAVLNSGFRQLTWELVMQGAGMALMPEGIAKNQLTGIVTRRLEPDVQRDVALVHHTNQLSSAALAFISTFTPVSQSLSAPVPTPVISMARSTKACATGES